MPRRSTSPTMLIVNFFMSAALPEAKQALDTAKAIVASREAAGLQQPSLPAAGAATPRRRRGRKPRQAALPDGGAGVIGAIAPAGADGPAATAPKPRRRRGRPAVAETPAVATDSVVPPGGVDLASLPAATE